MHEVAVAVELEYGSGVTVAERVGIVEVQVGVELITRLGDVGPVQQRITGTHVQTAGDIPDELGTKFGKNDEFLGGVGTNVGRLRVHALVRRARTAGRNERRALASNVDDLVGRSKSDGTAKPDAVGASATVRRQSDHDSVEFVSGGEIIQSACFTSDRIAASGDGGNTADLKIVVDARGLVTEKHVESKP